MQIRHWQRSLTMRTALLDGPHTLLHDDRHGHAFAQALHVQLNAKARARYMIDTTACG